MACTIPNPPIQFGRMPPSRGTYRQQKTMAMLVYQSGQGMMINIGQYQPSAGNMPMMQMGQQLNPAPMMMNYYAPNQQPNQQPGYFWREGAGCNELVTSVNTNCCSTPTHNYALVASILLKTINADAAAIKQWAILDYGARNHSNNQCICHKHCPCRYAPHCPPTQRWQSAVNTHCHRPCYLVGYLAIIAKRHDLLYVSG